MNGVRRDRQCALICAVTAIAGAPAAPAQETLRTVLQSDAAAELRSQPLQHPGDVLRIGPVIFDVRLEYSLEGSDNTGYVNENEESDLIQRPALNLGIDYQVSRQSRINLSVGVGYEDYADNSQEDSLFVTPGSEIAFDVRVGNGLITLYDRVDYSQDVVEQGALSGVARLPRLENIVGLRSVWRFDKWIWQAGYSHLNVLVTEESAAQDSFDHLARADEQFFGRGGHLFSPVIEAGLEASGSLSDYVSETQRDRQTATVGPYLAWTAADALEISLHGGGIHTIFNPTSSGMKDSDLTSYYALLEVKHRLTDHITYSFTAGHDLEAGINEGSDYIESTHLRLNGSWKVMRYLSLDGQVFGEASEERNVEGSRSEKYNRIGASIGATYNLTRRIALSLGYAFVTKDSDDESRSYKENRVTVGGSYWF